MKKSVLLVGDTILDKYEYLRPTGFSLETPTVKADHISSRKEFGGAANVASCLTRLGCSVDFITSVSKDDALELENSTSARIINVHYRTQSKERYYLSRVEVYKYLQINRCEQIPEYSIPDVSYLDYDICIVSDYRLGVLSKSMIDVLPKDKTLIQMQISDSKETINKYFGFHGIIGNYQEVQKDKIESYILDKNFKICVSTNGGESVIACSENERHIVQPDPVPEVKDFHGAGDAFYAGFCSTYNFSLINLRDSVNSGIRTANSFLRREQNAI